MAKDPRGVEARIAWFRTHSPGGVGLCARHTWRSLGGDYGNPPAWGCPHANCVYDKVIKAGRYWRTDPPRGAIVLWKYGKYGHAALSLGGGKILTTDPSGKPGGTGVESIGYPSKWGAVPTRRIWTDQYNGVRIPIKEDEVGLEYHYGGKPSSDQVVKTKYVDLDRSRWNPLRKGLEHAMIYINVSNAKFESGKQIGLLRVRAIREATNDATSYHDYPIIAGAGSQLITHPYFESGDGGPTHYEVKCHGGLVQVTLGTRYRKGAVIY